jgi:Ca2+-transporting ATPase
MLTGLSASEAARRFRAEGANELPGRAHRSLLGIVMELLREPMILLLLACGAIYCLLGDAQEAVLLLASIAVIIGIELFQAHKTERALEALCELSSPRALVIRDGQRLRIPGRDVVRGDLIVLVEGGRVPADGVVRASEHLLVDESLLTGESAPVRKAVAGGEAVMGRPGGEDQVSVFAGTLVVAGQGLAEVLAIGPRTEMGRIGASLRTLSDEETAVHRETRRLVKIFAAAGISLCILVVLLHGLSRGNWLQGFLAGLTLAISMVPEELPVVLTVFLALGAWRLSRQQVLTRRVAAVEMLGAATVLCVDKTGTLTLNRMAVQRLIAGGAQHVLPDGQPASVPEAFHEVVEAAILASRRDPFDPTEQALHALAGAVHAGRLRRDRTVLREYPMSRRTLAVGYVWESPDGRERIAAVKGAPEAVAQLCRLDAPATDAWMAATGRLASEGLRVLGVAKASLGLEAVPEELGQLTLTPLGLVGLADPVRPAVPKALEECRQAGIRVIMITGDYAATAQHIARQIGLTPAGEVITGPELEAMDDAGLQDRIRRVNLFARTVPEQKLRLVNALKASGEVVAMTGDGVNDAPALKAAHIGIAMGSRGTDVAREAAALVLLDDDFSSIVQAVRMGRRIFDNLKKAIAFIFAVHVPIAGIALLPLLLGAPLVLLPVHIVFLELIIDPACSVAFEAEPEESDVMGRPPRRAQEPLFGRQTFLLSMLQGVCALALVSAIFVAARWQGTGEPEARAMTFLSLVMVNLALIVANRSWSRSFLGMLRTPNRAVWWIVAGALGIAGLVVYIPALQQLFRFAPLSARQAGLCLLAGILAAVWFELLEAGSRKLRR